MLSTQIARYVSLYRSLGRKFSEQERLLRQYAAFAERFGDRHTRVQRIYDWCHTASSQNVARHRYDAARNFSLFAHAEDPDNEVPPVGVFGRGKRPRPTPTIIEADQVRAIMASQASRETRLHHADEVVENNADLATLRSAVVALHRKYSARMAKPSKSRLNC